MKWILGSQYSALGKEIQDLETELEEKWSMATTSVSRIQSIPGNGKSDTVASCAAAIADIKISLRVKIEELKNLRIRIESAIDTLPAEERRLLRLRYVRNFSWQQIAMRMYCDESTIRRKHRNIVSELNE